MGSPISHMTPSITWNFAQTVGNAVDEIALLSLRDSSFQHPVEMLQLKPDYLRPYSVRSIKIKCRLMYDSKYIENLEFSFSSHSGNLTWPVLPVIDDRIIRDLHSFCREHALHVKAHILVGVESVLKPDTV